MFDQSTSAPEAPEADRLSSRRGADERTSDSNLMRSEASSMRTDRRSQAVVNSDTSQQPESSSSPTILRAPDTIARMATYHAIQEWEGYVEDIGDDVFAARLVDLTSQAAPEERAELPLADLTLEQRSELRTGAVFRFTIGYEKTPGGQRKRVSQIIFRQLPRWTQRELEDARAAGKARAHALRWE
jgi:hypothetical protein